jgi:hypothetical protein
MYLGVSVPFTVTYNDMPVLEVTDLSSFKYFKRNYGIIEGSSSRIIDYTYHVEYNNHTCVFNKNEELVLCSKLF